MKRITILLVDDHRLLRESWCGILNSDGRFLVIGDTGEGLVASELFKTLHPDIVILDLNMSLVGGFEVLREIRKVDHSARVIGLSINSAIASAKRFFSLGAMGYLTKNSSKEEMMKAIIEVNAGNKYICEEVKSAFFVQESEVEDAFSGIKRLSKREIEIVQQLKMGLTSREISKLLDISFKTVEAHRYNLLKKLHLKNSASLINFCNINGI